MADELPPLIQQITGDASDLFHTLDEVIARLEAFASKNWEATLGLDTTEALTELAAFEALADSTNITIPVHLDTGGAYAQLASLKAASALAAGTGSPAGGGGTAGTAGADAATIASLLATSRTTAGSQGISGLYGIPLATGGGGGGGGGAGTAGLLASLGFGRNASGGVMGFGAGLAGFGTLGSLAGLGPESLATTLLGIGGSGLGAIAGGGALALGAAGVTGVGIGTDMAGIGQALNDTKSYNAALNNLNQAIAVYGPLSTQAATATAQLHYTLSQMPAAAQASIVALSATMQQFKTLFDQATGPAEAKGAQILQQLVMVGEKFLPTIGAFASQNMTIIQASLQPLLTWIQGPGLQVFTQLEQIFQQHLPTAMQAFTQGIELLIKTLGFLAPYTGHFITFLDNLFTKLNGPDFGKFTGDIAKAIGIFHDWEGLIKAVGTAIYELFTHDAGTGTSIVVMLTNMINKFNDWVKTTSGGDSLHAVLESHKNEILAIIGLLGNLISSWGQLEVTVRPVLQDLVAGLVDFLNFLFKIPDVGKILAFVFVFEVLGSKIKLVGLLLDPFNNLLKKLAIDGVQLLGTALVGLGGPFATLGGWLQGVGTEAPTAMEKAATGMQVAADSMATSATQISEALNGVGIAATETAATVDTAMGTIDEAVSTTSVDAEASTSVVDTAMESMSIAAAEAETGVATAIAGIAETLQGLGVEAADATDIADTAIASIGETMDLTETTAVAAAAGIAEAMQGIGLAAEGMAAKVEVSATAADTALEGIGGAAATGAAGVGAAGAGAAGTAGVAGAAGGTAAAVGGVSTTFVLGAAGVAALAGIFLGPHVGAHPAGGPDHPTQVGYVPQGTPTPGPGQQPTPYSGPIVSQATEQITAAQIALGNYNTNIKALAQATGLAQPYVDNLAKSLGINLHNALAPGQIAQFTNYVKQNGGAAGIAGQQWTQASQNIQSAMITMSTKAAVAMPFVSESVRNMITSVQPHLTDLVQKLNKTGDSGGAEFVSGFLANLTPAQLASKSMHDATNSPLIPLEQELRAIGDTSAANMIAAFIGHKGDAQNKSGQMHDAVKNPLYALQTELAATGDIAAAGFIQDFIKHNPEAATQAGLIHDAITGKLDPLINELETTGGSAGQNFVTSITAAMGTGNWVSLGSAVDTGVQSGISGSATLVADAAAGMAQGALTAARHAIAVTSPSKAFAEQVGKPIAQGMALGMTENASLVTDAGIAIATSALAATKKAIASNAALVASTTNAPSAPGSYNFMYGGNPVTENADGSYSIAGQTVSSLAGLSAMPTPSPGTFLSSLPSPQLGGWGGDGISPVSATSGGSQTSTVMIQQPVQVVLNGQVLGQTMQQILLKQARSQGNLFGGYAGGNQSGTATTLNTNAVSR